MLASRWGEIVVTIEPEVTLVEKPPLFWSHLWREFRFKPLEGLVTLAGVVGFIFGIVGLFLVLYQIQEVRAQLDDEAYGHLYDWLRTIDEKMIDHPEYRAYFNDGKTFGSAAIPPNVVAFAEFKLDFIDYFFTQAADLDRDNIEYGTWAKYFEDSFRSSPILCRVLKDEQDEYGYEIRYFAEPFCHGVTTPSGTGGSKVFWKYFKRP